MMKVAGDTLITPMGRWDLARSVLRGYRPAVALLPTTIPMVLGAVSVLVHAGVEKLAATAGDMEVVGVAAD